ncbi:CFEM domain-containing protein [Hirsutella rhossiliensis]|uniref:CFEM domain-containing protein n=1 Tax=Hirsutella rhossiliensis TaxID=111463 RepID=A0A9P8NA06_9HYPO|nr:CFEM domain-containing protein [Hirsutella rhossiliensis]KAH0968459.1 CFEM domain-containing protein [Hirsutella rhossiliensis]
MPVWLGQRDAPRPSSAAADFVLATLLPPCAVDCVTPTCSIADLACICRAGYYGVDEARSRCVIAACGFAESLSARNRTATACGAPVRDESARLTVMVASVFSLTAVFVALRLTFKLFFSAQRRLSIDDCFIVLASLVGISCFSVLLAGLNVHGLGRDSWALPPGEVAIFALYFYVVEILYLTLITLVRLTFTFFYLEIFSSRGVRILLWATVAFHVASGLTFVAKAIFQCFPVSYSWTRFDDRVNHQQHGRCLQVYASSWANAALSVAADLWLLAIPLTQLKRLNLHWKKKVAATLMFLAGAIGTIISVLRLRSIIHFAKSTNPTRDQFGIVWWSSIEVLVGMMCTCLPALRLILVRMWPRIFGVGSHQRSNLNLRRDFARRTQQHPTEPMVTIISRRKRWSAKRARASCVRWKTE